MRILPVVFARADSSRLPGKVLSPILGSHSVIDCIITQVRALAYEESAIAEPVIATSTRSVDDSIARYGEGKGVQVYRGALSPMLRLCELASANVDAWLWRLNADSPLILFPLIKHIVSKLSDMDDATQLITNLNKRTFPYGISLEMYCSRWLREIVNSSHTEEEREHITPICKRLNNDNICNIEANDLSIPDFDSTVRLTIDYEEDADFFGSLWLHPVFDSTEVGSIERITMAYKERIKL
ncbi:cytidylyltransferase domain-containing protein [Alteromonas lipotrueae]|uniref:cytidylyltransferase domain-containing protein n=1 Tax=Alteromonas lipotrueae TaxID=2803814 RepID=UPI001C440ACD|nr:hypothetical protein [Alteromonas lipotrueae]